MAQRMRMMMARLYMTMARVQWGSGNERTCDPFE